MEDGPCRDHATLEGIYGGPTPLSLQFAGHCYWADKNIISSLILWRPAGRVHSCKLPHPGVIARDSGLDMSEGPEYSDGESWCLGGDPQERPVHTSGRRMMMMCERSSCFILNTLSLSCRFESKGSCTGRSRSHKRSRWAGSFLPGVRQPTTNGYRDAGNKEEKESIGGELRDF